MNVKTTGNIGLGVLCGMEAFWGFRTSATPCRHPSLMDPRSAPGIRAASRRLLRTLRLGPMASPPARCTGP